MNPKNYRFETLQVHAGLRPDTETGARGVTICPTAAYRFRNCDHAARLFELSEAGNIYTRLQNPTTTAYEERIAALYGAVGALAVSSGMSAILLTVLSLARSGDNIVASPYLYGGTYNQFRISLRNLGIDCRIAASERAEDFEALADELCHEYIERDGAYANKNDLTALFNIGYGLYVVTSNDGRKDNGLIVNTVSQVTNAPNRIAVTVNKANYSHHVIKQTGKMNVNCLSIDAPFSVFENFGFRSGRSADKFESWDILRSDNGLVFLPKYINSFMSLKVEQYIDLDTHGMFICSVTESRVISKAETMTYTYYQSNVKPKPETDGKKGFVCKVCGYVYEGDTLPEDFICPLCKHGAADFEEIK